MIFSNEVKEGNSDSFRLRSEQLDKRDTLVRGGGFLVCCVLVG